MVETLARRLSWPDVSIPTIQTARILAVVARHHPAGFEETISKTQMCDAGTRSQSFARRRVEVTVRFGQEPGFVETLEGRVAFQPGDAVVTGPRGESWPVSRERFEQTYEPVPPSVLMGQDGLYRSKPFVVAAWRTAALVSVSLPAQRGMLKAQPGDWIVKGPAGDEWVVADGIFQESYVCIDAPARS